MLRGQELLPPCPATARAQTDQLVPEDQQQQPQALRDALAAAAAVQAPLKILERYVKRKVALLRTGAQPGGKACRNDVARAMCEVRGGVECLQRWAQTWADGAIPPSISRHFLEQILRPVKKDNGKPRNISLMESLFKIASGLVQDAIRRRTPCSKDTNAEGLHWSQYGGQQAGPELMLMVHQGLMTLMPSLAYCSLDAENAYGTIRRQAMIEGTLRWCPEHARFLAAQWAAPNLAWVEESPGQWRCVLVGEGTAQGDTSSTPAFSRGLRVALEAAAARLRERDIWAHLPSLVDDMLLVTAPEHVESALAILREELAQIGLRLNFQKCAAYIPERSRDGSGPTDLITSIPQVQGGLPALGSAYGGEFETKLCAEAVAAEPARKRLNAAKRLAAECARFRREHRPEATTHAAWHILHAVAAKALVYDLRV